ncbi:MAG: single-stranded DNA-binding protein [Phycisphaerae bacterium]
MANFNKVILIGNLTRDPQLSYLPSQTPVVEIGLAVNRRYTVNGERREDTCFIDCRAFGKPAEIINQYMSKGRQLMVEGRLDFDTWQAQDGSRRSKHRVTIENFQFLDSGGGGGQSRSGGGGYQQQNQGQSQGYQSGGGQGGQQAPPMGGPQQEPDDFGQPPYQEDEDIPF